MNKFYKVIGENMQSCHGGMWTWTVGEWTPTIERIKPCVRGWHGCRRQDLIHWLGPVICEAEIDQAYIIDADKVVTPRMRLTRRIKTWNPVTQRLFAADCAERVLFLFETERPNDERPRQAIRAARLFALGRADAAARLAASDAAWAASAAAWAAAWAASAAASAASDAAGTAASAARAAAGAAARDAAGPAASDAASAAAGAAAWEWQTERLFDYLEGERTPETVAREMEEGEGATE